MKNRQFKKKSLPKSENDYNGRVSEQQFKHTLTFINISNSKMILMLSLYTMFIGEPCGKEALDGKEQSGIFNLHVNCRFRKLNNNRENIER